MLELPNAPLPLNSSLYIDRPPLERAAFAGLERSGALLRIKAPRKMGKSSLFVRMRSHAISLGYPVVYLDFRVVEKSIYENLDKFLRWICMYTAHELGMAPLLGEFWDENLGEKGSATLYFQTYILGNLWTPIILVFNEINEVFEYPQIVHEFLELLRFWHEQANHHSAFERLRLIVIHSTEVYFPIKIDQSPFHVGLGLDLPPFNDDQVATLAARYEITDFSDRQIIDLLNLVGGHPYLVQIALYALRYSGEDWTTLVKNAPTQSGIYRDYLQHYWDLMQMEPTLQNALCQLTQSSSSISLDPSISSKLYGMGLVKLDGNNCQFSCSLYRDYFSATLTSHYSDRLAQLTVENQRLKGLVNIDGLTRLPNRHYLDQYLSQMWEKLLNNPVPIAVLMIDIDCFKTYNDTYGHPQGDQCLRQVASTLRQGIKQQASGLLARYGGEEFIVVLPDTGESTALKIAEDLCKTVRSLRLAHKKTTVAGQYVSVSIGVASMIPQPQQPLENLIQTADQALYKAKQEGRDRAILGQFKPKIDPILTNKKTSKLDPFDKIKSVRH